MLKMTCETEETQCKNNNLETIMWWFHRWILSNFQGTDNSYAI